MQYDSRSSELYLKTESNEFYISNENGKTLFIKKGTKRYIDNQKDRLKDPNYLEYKILNKLHENKIRVPAVYGAEWNGVSYTVKMQKLNAKKFTEIINNPNVKTRTKLYYLLEAAVLVQQIHKLGYRHFDIKPDNIMISNNPKDKTTYRIDDNLPRTVDCQAYIIDFDTSFSLGYEGNYTLDYAAPEQLNNEPLDEMTDVYPFGIMLYEILEGKIPMVNIGIYDSSGDIELPKDSIYYPIFNNLYTNAIKFKEDRIHLNKFIYELLSCLKKKI